MADEQPVPSQEPTAEELVTVADKKPSMAVKVYASFKVYFEGTAYSVSAVNEVGPLDVLPGHHNFLCMLMPGVLHLETPQGTQDIKIPRALMHVKANRVVIFVDV